MVANITEGTAFDKRGLPFRRRNIRPGVITAAALAVVTALIWMIALTRPAEVHEAAVCNPPPPDAPALGDPVSPSTMASVAPAKLADTKIRVLNASGQGGQAGEAEASQRGLPHPHPAGHRRRLVPRRLLGG